MNTEAKTYSDSVRLLKELASKLKLKDATIVRKRRYYENSSLGTFVIPVPYIIDMVATIKVIVTFEGNVRIMSIAFRYKEDVYTLTQNMFMGVGNDYQPEWLKDVVPSLAKVEASDKYNPLDVIAEAASMLFRLRGEDL